MIPTYFVGFDVDLLGYKLMPIFDLVAMSKGNLYSVEMLERKAATADPIAWTVTNPPNFDVSNYKPVMALAQNHIHFLDTEAGEGNAHIFVIHCQ
jgi:hypothetical protein